jgi:RNA polymerase sigma factor (TIGR02999 family)
MSEPTKNDIEALATRLYPQMRTIARHYSRRYSASETQRPTALVNEAFLKLRQTQPWLNEKHFLAAVALSIRHILLNDARDRLAQKRQSATVELTDEIAESVFWESDERLLKLDDALNELAKLDERLAQIVEYRFFGGYTELEVAELLGISSKTVQRDWLKAKALLSKALHEDFL